VAGRELVFSNPEIVRLASTEIIPVAADDWYQRRRLDPEGEFFRKVADQGPRKGQGGSTRQGVYCFTASGKLLAYRNPNSAEVMLEDMKKALAAWKRMPEAERKPGGVSVPEQAEEVDKNYLRVPPQGALIVNVYTRVLDRDSAGKFCTCTPTKTGRSGYEGLGSALDHLWITEAEWKSLAPGAREKGTTYDVPKSVAERILRFHLVDNTRGEPDHWTEREIHSQRLSIHVLESSVKEAKLRLEGSALLAQGTDIEKSRRGYDVALLGELTFNNEVQRFTRFDMVALGNHWGQGTFTGRARPGKTPLGVAFELADPANPRDRIPPQGARGVPGYLGSVR
jgi:hypothetical protein